MAPVGPRAVAVRVAVPMRRGRRPHVAGPMAVAAIARVLVPMHVAVSVSVSVSMAMPMAMGLCVRRRAVASATNGRGVATAVVVSMGRLDRAADDPVTPAVVARLDPVSAFVEDGRQLEVAEVRCDCGHEVHLLVEPGAAPIEAPIDPKRACDCGGWPDVMRAASGDARRVAVVVIGVLRRR